MLMNVHGLWVTLQRLLLEDEDRGAYLFDIVRVPHGDHLTACVQVP